MVANFTAAADSVRPQTKTRSLGVRMTSKYGMAECYGCYVRLPKPEMYRSTRSMSKPPANRTREYWGSRGGVYQLTGRSVVRGQGKQSSKTVWRCWKCYRRHLIKWALLWTTMAAIMLVIFMAAAEEQRSRMSAGQGAAVNQSASPTVPVLAQPLESDRIRSR